MNDHLVISPQIEAFCAALQATAGAVAVVTLLKVEGHVPQDAGAKAIITKDGLQWGTVGGGKLEARAIQVATEYLHAERRDPEILYLDLQRDLGMTCGGAATLAIEFFYSPLWNIAVFGAGHVAQALVPLLSTMKCAVKVVDPREELLTKISRAKNVQSICISEPKDIVANLDSGTHCVIVTRGHATDVPILAEVLKRDDLGYVGVIGSVVKKRALKAALFAQGFDASIDQKFETPMGIDIGTNDPAEIAISIAARLLQARK